MNLTPLGDRVLIRPDANPTQTASGLHLVEHAKPETQGEVIAVGLARHPLHDVAENTAKKLEAAIRTHNDYFDGEENSLLTDAATLIRQVTHREPLVQPGQRVLFSWQSGQELRIEDERYLLMREDDILAIVE